MDERMNHQVLGCSMNSSIWVSKSKGCTTRVGLFGGLLSMVLERQKNETES